MPYKKAPSKKRPAKKRVTRKVPLRRYVNRLIQSQAETKKHSLAVTENTVSTLTSPSNSTLHFPLQLQAGSGLNNRIGHKVTGVGLDVRGHFYLNSSSVQSFAKMVIFRKKNMSASPVSDLLETNSGDVSGAGQGVQKMYSRFNTDDYQILATRMVSMGSADAGERTRFFKCWVPLKQTFTYDGSGTSSPAYNDINIIFYTAESAADETLGTTIECTFTSTFYFKDM